MIVSSLRFIALFAALIATSAVHAEQVFFDSSFTTAEGFADGQITQFGSNPQTIIGQGGFQISDAAGTGILNGGSNFQRALFGWNAGMDENFVNNTATEIRVSVTGLVFNPTGRKVANFGLSNVDGGNPTGGSKLAGGVQFAMRASDGAIFLDTEVNDGTFDYEINTGFTAGQQFDYEQRWLAVGGGVFHIDHLINGNQVGPSFNVTPNFNLSSTQVTGFIQDANQAGTYSMDSLRLSAFSSVPEPSSLGLFAVGIAAVASRRRRR